MADRKAELERKRAKLNALREEKERKKKEKEELDRKIKIEDGAGDRAGQGDVSLDVDEYLKSLGIQSQSDTSIFTDEDKSFNSLGDPNSSATKAPLTKAEDFQKKVDRLTMSQVTQTNIPAHETVTYAKETQTAQSGPDHRDYEYNLNPGLEWDDEFAEVF